MYLSPAPKVRTALDIFELASAGGLTLENLEEKLPDTPLADAEKIVKSYGALMTVPYYSCNATLHSVVVKAKRLDEVRELLRKLSSPLKFNERIDSALASLRRTRKNLPLMRYQTLPALKGCNTGC